MRLEVGEWPVAWPMKDAVVFRHRVVIERPEFPRLYLADFEERTASPPCVSWCHDHMPSTDQWCFATEPPIVMNIWFYFLDPSDAMAFYLRWA